MGLIVHYTFDDFVQYDETYVPDSSGNGYYAYPSAGAQLSTSARKGAKSLMAGIPDGGTGEYSYVDIPLSVGVYGADPRSILMWIKTTNASSDQFFFVSGGDGTEYCRIQIGVRAGGRIFVEQYGTGAYFDQVDGPLVNDDSWHHVALTYDGTTERLFIDGTLCGAKTAALQTSSGGFFRVGAGTFDANTAITGHVDDFRFYDTALTAEEIAEIVGTNSNGDTLELWHKYDESGSSLTAADSSGHARHGSLQEFIQFGFGVGRKNNALFIDGSVPDDGISPQWVTVPWPGMLGTKAFTVALWVRATGNPYETGSQYYDQTLVSWGDNDQDTGGRFELALNGFGGSQGSVTIGTGNAAAGWNGQPIFDENWHHIAVTKAAGAKYHEIYLWVDGVSQGKATSFISNRGDFVLDIVSSGSLWVGSWYGQVTDESGQGFFAGGLDDLRIYSRVLSATEIATLAGNDPTSIVCYPITGQITSAAPVYVNAGANMPAGLYYAKYVNGAMRYYGGDGYSIKHKQDLLNYNNGADLGWRLTAYATGQGTKPVIIRGYNFAGEWITYNGGTLGKARIWHDNATNTDRWQVYEGPYTNTDIISDGDGPLRVNLQGQRDFLGSNGIATFMNFGAGTPDNVNGYSWQRPSSYGGGVISRLPAWPMQPTGGSVPNGAYSGPGWDTQALAEAASQQSDPIYFEHSGGPIGLVLYDDPYTDNYPGVPNPTWSVCLVQSTSPLTRRKKTMTISFPVNSTSKSIYFRIYNGLDPKTDLTYSTSGLVIQYHRTNGSLQTITLQSIAATSGWTTGGFVHVGSGEYRLDVPDAALLAGVDFVSVIVTDTASYQAEPVVIQLTSTGTPVRTPPQRPFVA